MLLHRPLTVALTASLAAAALHAQCASVVTPFAPAMQLTNGSGSSIVVYAALKDTNGDLIVGGDFSSAGGIPMTGLARWDGTTWSPFATLGGNSPYVNRLFRTRRGDLFVNGSFASIDGFAASGAARRDANGWHDMPPFTAPIEDAQGNVYVNSGGVTRWDGVAWTYLGAPMSVTAMSFLANGDLAAAGLQNQGTLVWSFMRWDGTTWTELQPVVHPASMLPFATAIRSLRTLRNGDLLVAGSFLSPFGDIAIWNSTGWHDVGGSFRHIGGIGTGVYNTAELPNGDLFVSGWFDLPGWGVTSSARFDGTTWHPIGGTGGVLGMTAFDETSYALSHLSGFGVGTTLSFFHSTCPAETASIGTACPSSGGNNELTAVGRPWIGSTFATRATGLPTTCVVAVVNGFATFHHPLSNVLPMAAPSCEHRETVDMLDLLVTNNGTATWSVAVPDVPALIGLVAYQQMFPLEVDAQLQILAASSTNTLRLQVGAF